MQPKNSHILAIAQFGKEHNQFDAIIDVRSPAEFALDHIPGAINFPVLNNEERVKIGTLYKQVSPFAAKKLGAAIVSRNIAQHLEQSFLDFPREWRPLLYCWRGGERSGAFTHVLNRIGWKAMQLEGGYQGFRRVVIDDLDLAAKQFQFQVICGMTGSGKTRILHELQALGAQVLDLEGLAIHRGSVLGNEPDIDQPSQKGFETALWNALHDLDPNKPVFIESESKKVGGVHVPDALMEKIRHGRCIELRSSVATRVSWLLHEYAHFLTDTTTFKEKLALLTSRYGKVQIAEWLTQIDAGHFDALVTDLLVKHYDPAYQSSIVRNFPQYRPDLFVELQDDSDTAFAGASQKIISKFA
ncbi:tRNA 2-selenouridine(34) synthase MnmH [Polynucleobacter paneuropaeus]|uniref:tRNA 2-selenouridine(34) synthase MnmH n=1 Tax=Polynucleobacter paneuropaeus TaxID=2527775 RepID=A0A2Z4JSN3_9BURK|nr:tRNA 2-selenouridine(34) synthase MnmH [Polynucleobacter paneuropaeus]AWW49811.1 tRNA 2-selenouridine(34) synthase MnmH [Polynucleobacter paneuropaeus]QWD11699.1 tRNA 2-selenouridine(34) synthase MnmH [Polynucleobacter paneuropaeus]QWD44987.1 tRNA 2-selenouridine(34) synthase MnmH [Polynucleobacter paneuropaeus]